MILAEPQKLICDACLRKLPRTRAAGPRCMRCSRPISDGRAEYCHSCAGRHVPYDRACAAFIYEKGMRRSVLRMKYENRREYLDFYAAALLEESRSFLAGITPQAILPVPMHPKKIRERGFDQCALLAEKLSRLCGLPVIRGNLVRVRHTLPQKGLSGTERRQNLEGAFRVLDPGRLPPRLLILDDILTTGSTVEETARVLRENGVRSIWVLTLCITRDARDGGGSAGGGPENEEENNAYHFGNRPAAEQFPAGAQERRR